MIVLFCKIGWLVFSQDLSRNSGKSMLRVSSQKTNLKQGAGHMATLKSFFNELYGVYKSNLKSWWEVKALENHIKYKILPKGIRINLTPSIKTRLPQLFEKWEKESISSSLKFMRILLEK